MQNKPTPAARVAMIFCYYGKFPWYFSFFVHSAAYNKDVDFFLVTDIPIDDPLPDNFFMVHRSLAELQALFSLKLGFETGLYAAYKLCDFKPAYGYLFADLIAGYDFWGHGDIDVIYGNIRSIITDDLLNSYDVISIRQEYLSGFFTLFRNNTTGRELFMQSPDYKMVFQDPANHCFDETNWHFTPLLEGRSIFELKMNIQCMSYIIKKMSLCGDIRAYFYTHATESLPGRMKWSKGQLVYDKTLPVVLYHLIQFKELPYFFVPRWKRIPATFFINEFYISRFAPESLPGRGLAFVLKPWRGFQSFLKTANQYGQWLKRYNKCTKKIRMNDFPNVEQYTGVYKMREDGCLQVFIKKGKLFACMNGGKPVLLVHEKKSSFMLSKFGLQEDGRNIDVQFHYDHVNGGYTMHFIPNQLPAYIFNKIE